MSSPLKVIVIGAGASGLMAAGRAGEMGAEVTLLEKTDRAGQKILISGNTRCNLSNSKDFEGFIAMYGDNGRFLYSAFRRFFREDLLEILRKYGVETRVERGGRIFPVSERAEDVVNALQRYLADNKVRVVYSSKVTGLTIEDRRVSGVATEKGGFEADVVIIAAGGASFPATGSSGDGYRFAAGAGHTITKLRPALVPLLVKEIELARSMQGVSLRNVRLTAFRCPADEIDSSLTPDRDWGRGTGGRRPHHSVIESRLGEMMMTHFGIGGPITLLMSLSTVDALDKGPVSVSIDLKPGLKADLLRARLQRDFDASGKKTYRNILKGLLPQKIIEPFVGLTGIPEDKPGNQLNAFEKDKLLRSLKSLRFNIKGPLPLSSAIVTAGGVSLDEIDPRRMASRLVGGLYFCGEVMDIDADTGGYNLQAAFSTGFVAGESAALDLP